MYEKEFLVLGIEKTREENAIRTAYRQKLAVTNPEDKPEEFKELRAAYEEALKYARTGELDGQEESVIYTRGLGDSPVAQWLGRVIDLCSVPELRYNADEWKKLLAEDACNAFDTAQEAALALFSYLMDHYYLSAEVFRLLDDKFEIRANEAEWKEQLPVGFVDYMIDKIRDEEGNTDYSFEWLKGEKGADFDSYIRDLEELNNRLWEKNLENAAQLLKKLEQTGIWHPFYELGKIRYEFLQAPDHKLSLERKEAVLRKMKELMEAYPSSRRIPLEVGEFLWWCEEYEASAEAYKELKKRDCHYMIDKYLARYEFQKGNLKEAVLLFDRIYGEAEPEVEEWIRQADLAYTVQFTKELPADPEELLLYLYACIRLSKFEEIKRAKKERKSFMELKDAGYILYQYYCEKKDNLLAKRALEQWCDAQKAAVDTEGEREYGVALALLAKHCMDMYENSKRKDTGVLHEGLAKASRAEQLLEGKDARNLLVCRYTMLRILMELKEYTTAYEMAGKILEKNPGLFQVILLLQKCCMEMQKPQEVVDLYHRGRQAVQNNGLPEEMAEEYAQLFENATEIFQMYHQLGDAAKILEEARQQNCRSNRLILLQILVDQKTAAGKKDRALMLQTLQKTVEGIAELKARKADGDILGKAYLAKAILECAAEPEKDTAQRSVRMALNFAPGDKNLIFSCGRILMSKNNYEEAKRCFLRLAGADGYTPDVYCNLVECEMRLQRLGEALALCEEIKAKEENLAPFYDLFADLFYAIFKSTEKKQDASRLLEYSIAEIKYLEEKQENAGRYYAYSVEAYLTLEQYADAAIYVDAVLARAPKNPYFLMQKARVCMGQGDQRNAMKLAEQAYEAASAHQKEFYMKFACFCSLRQGDPGTIVFWHERFFSTAEEKEQEQAYKSLLWFLRNRNNADAAVNYIIKREKDGCCGKERTKFALLRAKLMKAGKNPFNKHSLAKCLAGLLEEEPQPFLWREAGYDYLFFLNRPKKAIECLEKYITISDGKMSGIYPVETAMLLQIYRDLGEEEKEKQLCRMFFALIKERTNTEDETEAVAACLEKGLGAEHGRRRMARIRMAVIYAVMRDAERAREMEREALEYGTCGSCIFHFCVDLEYLRGCIFEAEGNYEEARRCYRRILQEAPGFEKALWRLKCIKKK